MPDNSQQIVQKLWNYCNVLRDDGVSYGDYVEQLTYLLFLKMADEQTIKQGLKQSNRLRQSILKKAFEGKLVPQDPEDEPAEKLLERIKAEKVKLQVG